MDTDDSQDNWEKEGETLFLTTIFTRSLSSIRPSNSFMTEILSYKNQSIGLQSRSIDCFKYIRDLRHERVYLKLWIRIINRFIYNYQTGIQQDWLSWWISIWLNVNWILFVDCKFVVINFSERPLIRNSLPSAKNLLDMWVTEYL